MKSQVRIVLALLLVFSAGLAAPSFAGAANATRSSELVCPASVRAADQAVTSRGPGDIAETDGDPDGWLGGQNLRPTPPIESGSDEESLLGVGPLNNFLYFILIFIGLG